MKTFFRQSVMKMKAVTMTITLLIPASEKMLHAESAYLIDIVLNGVYRG
jgi:hypothetical protein